MFFENIGKAGIFGQESVAGMHSFGTGDFTCGNNGGNIEITVFGRWWPDADTFVGQLDVHGIGVGGGMHRNSLDAKLAAGTQYAKCNFAAICDEDFFKHRLFNHHQYFTKFHGLTSLQKDLHDFA